MPTTQNAAAELAAAISELSGTVALSGEALAGLIATALIAAYRRTAGDDPTVRSQIDLEAGVWSLIRSDDEGNDVPIPLVGDLARQAARGIRSAVAGRLRDVESDDVI